MGSRRVVVLVDDGYQAYLNDSPRAPFTGIRGNNNNNMILAVATGAGVNDTSLIVLPA